MRKVLTAIFVLLLPCLILLNVWQSFSYQRMEADIADMESRQRKMLEDNKRLIIGIEYLRTPMRIEKIAEEQLGMKRVTPGERALITVSGGNDDG